MKVENIIEGLNKHIEDRRETDNISAKGHIVFQRVITSDSTFKVYKTYENILWFVNGDNKYRVLTVKHTSKVPEGQEELMERKVDTDLCYQIFNWVGSNFYEQVLTGIYKGYEVTEI